MYYPETAVDFLRHRSDVQWLNSGTNFGCLSDAGRNAGRLCGEATFARRFRSPRHQELRQDLAGISRQGPLFSAHWTSERCLRKSQPTNVSFASESQSDYQSEIPSSPTDSGDEPKLSKVMRMRRRAMEMMIQHTNTKPTQKLRQGEKITLTI